MLDRDPSVLVRNPTPDVDHRIRAALSRTASSNYLQLSL
jgi:hypothetical protein